KRRGLVIVTFALTVAVTAVVYGILALLHTTNAAKHGLAGGQPRLQPARADVAGWYLRDARRHRSRSRRPLRGRLQGARRHRPLTPRALCGPDPRRTRVSAPDRRARLRGRGGG